MPKPGGTSCAKCHVKKVKCNLTPAMPGTGTSASGGASDHQVDPTHASLKLHYTELKLNCNSLAITEERLAMNKQQLAVDCAMVAALCDLVGVVR